MFGYNPNWDDAGKAVELTMEDGSKQLAEIHFDEERDLNDDYWIVVEFWTPGYVDQIPRDQIEEWRFV